MTRPALVLIACAIAACAMPQRADAISREEDIVRDLGQIFKAPSTYPPNPLLRPNVEGDAIRVISPIAPDEGPATGTTPESPPIRAYPFLAALVEGGRPPQEGYVCAGTLIAPHWILTAAHCTFNWSRRWPTDPDAYALFDTSRLSAPGPRYRIDKIIAHPQYDPRGLKNDLALVRIDTKGATAGVPLRLEGPPSSEQAGEIGHVLGWGSTNINLLKQPTGSLQFIQVTFRGDDCFSAATYGKLKGTGVFCASSLFRFHDVCYRFSGGPLFTRDAKGIRYLIGMVSWSATCPPQVDRLNLFLDVQFYVPWIKSIIAANGGPD